MVASLTNPITSECSNSRLEEANSEKNTTNQVGVELKTSCKPKLSSSMLVDTLPSSLSSTSTPSSLLLECRQNTVDSQGKGDSDTVVTSPASSSDGVSVQVQGKEKQGGMIQDTLYTLRNDVSCSIC